MGEAKETRSPASTVVIDNRGWGDMVDGTAVEWPVPYDELFARGILSVYTTSAKAAKGTYGF